MYGAFGEGIPFPTNSHFDRRSMREPRVGNSRSPRRNAVAFPAFKLHPPQVSASKKAQPSAEGADQVRLRSMCAHGFWTGAGASADETFNAHPAVTAASTGSPTSKTTEGQPRKIPHHRSCIPIAVTIPVIRPAELQHEEDRNRIGTDLHRLRLRARVANLGSPTPPNSLPQAYKMAKAKAMSQRWL